MENSKENNKTEERWTFEKVWAMFEETNRQIKEVTKNIYGISISNGAMAEEAVYNALKRDMNFGGMYFDDISRNVKRESFKKNLQAEFDAVLKNGSTLAIIETKYKVQSKDVYELATTKLENYKKLFPEYSDYDILLGVGGMSFEDAAIQEAKTLGIGIIKIVGDKIEYYTENIKKY